MTIAILPARLANQIAAGEVVERPASVIKELIENSLDAGATAIQITVDKGGVKKIKITDNGSGIAKDELALALSRHATSKIKDLSDLEAIDSLGFRGEALASISSVARLTLTSKPQHQDTAWQATAAGRDMAVNIQPAAHPDGTTIEVLDLFFNTPARRKFLRTEKTEFNHIDEIVRRIALARFDVSFTLTHNGKVVRQYRIANTQAQNAKRVAMVCGQKFIEHAIEVNCEHDNMKLSGWVAKPSFARNQNDLCYSYVNGRMMRDKLINHAIRQAYSTLLPADTYPAFVLFLQVDCREVDVNVHPAKHEVRFHQSRYVHDFIYSVCHKALLSINNTDNLFNEENNAEEDTLGVDNIRDENSLISPLQPEQSYQTHENSYSHTSQAGSTLDSSGASSVSHSVDYQRPSYVTPLQHVNDNSSRYANQSGYQSKQVSPAAVSHYEQLLNTTNAHETTSIDAENENHNQLNPDANSSTQAYEKPMSESLFIHYAAPGYGLYKHDGALRLLSLFKFAQQLNSKVVASRWLSTTQTSFDYNNTNNNQEQGLVSQPLLLPVMITLSVAQESLLRACEDLLTKAGIVFVIKTHHKVQIRQFPALLRDKDVSSSFITIIDALQEVTAQQADTLIAESDIFQAIGQAMLHKEYTQNQADNLIKQAITVLGDKFSTSLLLNSVPVDLTSSIKQLH
ncbi:DNA mismatch repair endonuclease MutL [Colwellia sp. D2M02]|uniref:DNA mismatch repair endonuclease MutL n=1 Tax=Colwellia sp. D2M02 TaxID=2841562 RepID=UPI001C08A84B|nr:DNA mismatch repair endonuclease MutL [Colwellia sp. D2M02]MBU2895001.1 DNA mismatch repair endonuclease MutL [Colwellia sp. D2M02]